MTSGMRYFNSFDLGLQDTSVRVAGQGGYASVEIGIAKMPHKHLVAVKRSRMPSASASPKLAPKTSEADQDDGLGGVDFEQLTLEMRILGHRRLRKHANVVDILGLCIDEFNDSPTLALVLEYSAHGTLGSFMARQRGGESEIPVLQRVDFILQVARGLEAVHKLKVCHGDVKTENALVFAVKQQKPKWTQDEVKSSGGSSSPTSGRPSSRRTATRGAECRVHWERGCWRRRKSG